ncbi:MAG: zinc-ribbon domain-containing protein [Desulfobacteraceae bacterium]|nr:zinc-ribbon domain-containing protein [Desulfobacteraceae bacterium]
MTVICEECGKVYHLDPDKLERYRGQSIRVRCGECGHVTQLSRLMETTELPEETYSEPSYATADAPPEDAEDAGLSLGQPGEEESSAVAGGSDYSGGDSSSGGWIGLRGKMFFLFLVIPVMLMAVSGYFSYMQIDKLTTEITDQSTELVAEAGKEQLLQKARDVAVQCEIYLRTHPELEREDFSYDPTFNQIAVQAVGESGYTCLIEEETADRDAIIWAHPNPNLIGIPNTDTLRKALGPYFEGFWEILENSWGRKESTGTYMWKDTDGDLREKYMAIAPINIEGKKFSLLATAYMDEFTERTEGLRESAEQMTMETRNINLGILGGAILIIGFCIIVYGYRLTRKIRYLTEAADRISVGDLEAEIEVRSKDEIGSLAEAISRMQDSLRFSIERLRRRR